MKICQGRCQPNQGQPQCVYFWEETFRFSENWLGDQSGNSGSQLAVLMDLPAADE